MLIRFSKPKGVPVLTCVRDDGSTTWSKSAHGEFFAVHDLLHFAVKSTLGLRHSFFSLIAQGRSISSFNEPGAAAKLPPEAVHTEFIVGQLQQELSAIRRRFAELLGGYRSLGPGEPMELTLPSSRRHARRAARRRRVISRAQPGRNLR